MTLYKRTLIIVGLILSCLIIILYLICESILLDSFSELEHNSVRKDIKRAVSVLNDAIAGINREAGDWATWDDSYAFIDNGDKEYIKKNLSDEAFVDLKLNLIVYINKSFEIIYMRSYDYQNRVNMSNSPGLKVFFTPEGKLIQHTTTDSAVSGLIMLPEGPMMVASRPILTSKRTGPVRGALIMGRYLNNLEIESLAKITHLTLTLNTLNELEPIKDNILASNDGIFINAKNKEELIGYALIRDVDNKPAFVLRVDMQREIYKQGSLVIKYLIISLTTVGIIFIGVLLLLLSRMVLSRVANLSRKVQIIGGSKDLKARIDIRGNDELNILTDSINKMLDALEESEEHQRTLAKKLHEVDLLQSEERFYKVFHACPVMMSIIRIKDWVYLDVNEAWLVNHGLTRKEVIGGTENEINKSLNLGLGEELFEKFKEKSGYSEHEMEYVTPGGEIHYVISSAQIMNLKGEPCLLETTVDVTERKKMEKEIARLDNLNLVGEMAAGIGHEIRNPMTTVRGFLQMLGEKQDCSRYKKYYDLMIEELDRTNSIITEYLSLAKNKEVSKQARNLNSIVEAIFPLIQADVMRDNKYIELELKDIPDLFLDEKEIRQMILNLVRNGREAMSSGKTLKIKTYAEKDKVVMVVEDEGSGIPPEIAGKIGTPFFTTKDTGTGLGLAVCYSIAERHNARIDFKTENGKTKFFVRFNKNFL